MSDAADGALAPSLRGAAWLADMAVTTVFQALNRDGDSVRAIGGAVRDALLGRPVREVDFATTAPPAVVERRAAEAKIKVVPTGIEHGTLTLVTQGRAFEVTSLREDIQTDGRRAVVQFGRDWRADAERRDFSVNALSVEADGTVHDPLGGYRDILARRIRFIGDPDRRIAEDRLRILRFFRLHAELGAGEPDAAGLGAAIRARAGLSLLSGERIGREMRRLAAAAGAPAITVHMQDAGILPVVLGGIGYPVSLARLVAFEQATDLAPAAGLRLAALACRIAEDTERLAGRLRLSNAERDAILGALGAARLLAPPPGRREARRLLYRLGPAAFADGAALAAATGTGEVARWSAAAALPRTWSAPAFPLAGRDALAAGIGRGPEIGAALRDLEQWWVEQDFVPDRELLLRRLQQRLSAGQQ